MEEKKVVIKGFPVGLHRWARVQAAKEDSTFKAVVIKALEMYLKKKGG